MMLFQNNVYCIYKSISLDNENDICIKVGQMESLRMETLRLSQPRMEDFGENN